MQFFLHPPINNEHAHVTRAVKPHPGLSELYVAHYSVNAEIPLSLFTADVFFEVRKCLQEVF